MSVVDICRRYKFSMVMKEDKCSLTPLLYCFFAILYSIVHVSNVNGNDDDDDDCSIAAESNGGCTNSTFGCTINAGTYSTFLVLFFWGKGFVCFVVFPCTNQPRLSFPISTTNTTVC